MTFTREITRSCPRCASGRIVEGELFPQGQLGTRAPALRFRAHAARASLVRLGVEVDDLTRVCAECGLVWNELSVRELDEHLARFESPEVKRWRAERLGQPLRGPA